MNKRIIFIGENAADYLTISLLHGFKQINNIDLIEATVFQSLYKNYERKIKGKVRGKGFSLFFLIPGDAPLHFNILDEYIRDGNYDLIIFNDIERNYGKFLEYYPFLDPEKTCIIDGSDSSSLFPYSGKFWRSKYSLFYPRVNKHFQYFKREWTPQTFRFRCYKLLPRSIAERFYHRLKNLHKISFSIPEEKIVCKVPKKVKIFTKHIVDNEVADLVEGSSTSYAFEDETEYYKDLQLSRFGITTKRSGWDCLRHYEIAANGCVPCFRNLHLKPRFCAPHGLNDTNTIIYSDVDDLMKKIQNISDTQYNKLAQNAINWAHSKSTKVMAEHVLSKCLL